MASRLRCWFVSLVVISAIGAAAPGAEPPVEPEVQIQLGDLLFHDGRYDDAADAYRRGRDMAEGEARMRAGRGLVRSLLRTADFRHARDEAARLVEESPGRADVLAVQGDALWAAGFFDEADACYAGALKIDPQSSRSLNGLARSLATRNQLDAALDHATRAVALDPREADFHHTVGYVRERLRQFGPAADALTTHLGLLTGRDRTRRALWTQQQIRFLRSFGERVPMAMTPEVALGMHVIPFRIVRDKVVVEGRINGRRGDIVLDTGAELTTVTKRTAESAGVEPIVYTLSAGVGGAGLRGLQIGRADRLQIGTLRLENVPTLIKNPPLRDLPTSEADSFSPLAFGLSVSIDYSRRVLTMARWLPETPALTSLPMRVHRLALVRGLVNDRNAVHFVVDTGGEVISISRSTFDAIQREPPRRIPLRVYGTSGWDPDAFLMPYLDLAFDTVRLSRQAVVVLNLDAPSALLGFDLGGIVGHRFLSRYRVSMDMVRSEVRLGAI